MAISKTNQLIKVTVLIIKIWIQIDYLMIKINSWFLLHLVTYHRSYQQLKKVYQLILITMGKHFLKIFKASTKGTIHNIWGPMSFWGRALFLKSTRVMTKDLSIQSQLNECQTRLNGLMRQNKKWREICSNLSKSVHM